MVLYAGPEATVPPAELELMKGGKSYHTTSRPKLIKKMIVLGPCGISVVPVQKILISGGESSLTTSRPAEVKMLISGGESSLNDEPAC